MIISPAVSNGHALPTGLNGSCRLSAPGRHVDPGGAQGGDGGQPARHRGTTATLQEQVGVGERDHVDAGLGHELGDRALVGLVALAEADAVAGAHRPIEPGEDGTGEIAQAVDAGVERLVGVQVDADPEVRGDLEQDRRGLGGAGSFEVRAATDQVGACRDRVAQQRPLGGAVRAGQRPAGEGDDLDVDHVADSGPHRGQRLDAAQPVLERHVDVGADGTEAVARHQAGGTLGTLGDVRRRREVPTGGHRLDRSHQVAGRVLDALGEERLVEVGVWFDRGRQQEMTVEVDGHLTRRRRQRADLGDHAVDDAHVARVRVGDAVADDPCPSGASRAGSSISGMSKTCPRT